MGILKYIIPSAKDKWSRTFGIMENAKKELKILDYSLGQKSLSQSFLILTSYQNGIYDKTLK